LFDEGFAVPDLALGRLPLDPTKPKLQLRRLATQRPEAPAQCDWLSAGPGWRMLANDNVGCCTMAAAAHTAIEVDKHGQDRDLAIGDQQVLAAYAAISGWDGTPATDVGATLQDALDFWRATGVAGNTIAAFAWIDPRDLELVRACIATFGAVYTGMWVTAAAMAEFDRGQEWSYTGRSRLLGGHCVHLGAYDENGFTCVTWGRAQKMTTDFYLKYFDEVVVPVDLDWLRANGTSPTGFDIARLNADYTALTGAPGPFPEPPPPVLTPDEELALAFLAWQEAKGL
jgi:hypothetical protein